MKLSLTINDASPQEIQNFLNSLSGSSAIAINGPSFPPFNTTTAPPSNDDDDNAPTNTTAPSVDASGMPWDERIHSKAKTLTAENMWRKRKGVSADIITQIEAELRARSAPPQPQFQAPPQMMQPPAMPPQQQPQFQAPPQMMQPPAMPPQQMQQPQPQAPMDGQQFMQHLTNKMGQRDVNGMAMIDAAYLQTVVHRLNTSMGRQFNVVTDTLNDPAAMNFAISIMTQDGRW